MRRGLCKLVLVLGVAAACTSAAPADVLLSPLPPRPSTPGPLPSPILQLPNVVGMAFADARDALKTRGFKVKKKTKYVASDPFGEVLKQSRKVGAILPAGTLVRLTVAIPFPPPVNGNPWGYNWACCKKISSPPTDFCSFFACVTTFNNGTGFVVQCRDDLFSATGGAKTACSGHDGTKRTLLSP